MLSHWVFKQIFNITSDHPSKFINRLRLSFVDVIYSLLIHLDIAKFDPGLPGKLGLGKATAFPHNFQP